MDKLGNRVTRSDAWGEDLGEEKRWEIYDALRVSRWPSDVCAGLEERGIAIPSRAAWYRFLMRMRKADAGRRIERIAQSVAEAQAVADKSGIKAAVFVETLKTLAIDRAMLGDDKGSTAFAGAAASIWNCAQREKEIELKSRAQETKEDALRLAREKFEAAERREAAAKETVSDTRISDEERMAKLKEIYGI